MDDNNNNKTNDDEGKDEGKERQEKEGDDEEEEKGREGKRKLGASEGGDDVKKSKQQQEEQPLEDFERGACSDWVTKTDAAKLYCLPAGTLAVIKTTKEAPNPRNRKFAPMKLYCRSQVRRLAHERFGGVIGLQQERARRKQAQFEKNLKKARNVFN